MREFTTKCSAFSIEKVDKILQLCHKNALESVGLTSIMVMFSSSRQSEVFFKKHLQTKSVTEKRSLSYNCRADSLPEGAESLSWNLTKAGSVTLLNALKSVILVSTEVIFSIEKEGLIAVKPH